MLQPKIVLRSEEEGLNPGGKRGTGRARAGSRRSPIWRGGGTIFGPTPRNYSKKVNAKVHKLALKRAFTSRVDEGNVIVVDNLELQEPKTKFNSKDLENSPELAKTR